MLDQTYFIINLAVRLAETKVAKSELVSVDFRQAKFKLHSESVYLFVVKFWVKAAITTMFVC